MIRAILRGMLGVTLVIRIQIRIVIGSRVYKGRRAAVRYYSVWRSRSHGYSLLRKGVARYVSIELDHKVCTLYNPDVSDIVFVTDVYLL